MLLDLDNFEQLIPYAQILTELLDHCEENSDGGDFPRAA